MQEEVAIKRLELKRNDNAMKYLISIGKFTIDVQDDEISGVLLWGDNLEDRVILTQKTKRRGEGIEEFFINFALNVWYRRTYGARKNV